MTGVLTLIRRLHWFAPFAASANTFLMIAGTLLFLLQMHVYLHTTYPDEFGFSTKQHILDHFNEDNSGAGEPTTEPPRMLDGKPRTPPTTW